MLAQGSIGGTEHYLVINYGDKFVGLGCHSSHVLVNIMANIGNMVILRSLSSLLEMPRYDTESKITLRPTDLEHAK